MLSVFSLREETLSSKVQLQTKLTVILSWLYGSNVADNSPPWTAY